MAVERFPGMAGAYAAQLRRVNQATSPEELRREIERLAGLLETAHADLAAMTSQRDNLLDQLAYERKQRPQAGLTVNGRAVVSQAEAAKILSVSPYKVSRWVTAGHFEQALIPGRAKPLLYADTLHVPQSKKKKV